MAWPCAENHLESHHGGSVCDVAQGDRCPTAGAPSSGSKGRRIEPDLYASGCLTREAVPIQ